MTQELGIMINTTPYDSAFFTQLTSVLSPLGVTPNVDSNGNITTYGCQFPLTTSAFGIYGAVLNEINQISSSTSSQIDVEFLFPTCFWNRITQ